MRPTWGVTKHIKVLSKRLVCWAKQFLLLIFKLMDISKINETQLLTHLCACHKNVILYKNLLAFRSKSSWCNQNKKLQGMRQSFLKKKTAQKFRPVSKEIFEVRGQNVRYRKNVIIIFHKDISFIYMIHLLFWHNIVSFSLYVYIFGVKNILLM